MKELLAKLLERKNLSQEEAREMILWIMSEEAVPTQAAALLALHQAKVQRLMKLSVQPTPCESAPRKSRLQVMQLILVVLGATASVPSISPPALR